MKVSYVCVSTFALMALFFLCSENGTSGEATSVSAEREVVCIHINSYYKYFL